MSLVELEKNYIRQVLEENEWNITRSAEILGIHRVTLHKKIKRFDLSRN
jgi:two-component system response regulator HydG